MLRASKIQLDCERLPDGDAKRILLRSIERTRKVPPLTAALRVTRLSASRYDGWCRAGTGCDLDDHLGLAVTSNILQEHPFNFARKVSTLDVAASSIESVRRLLRQNGRRTEDLKFLQGLSFVIGSTEDEATRKSRELDEAIDHGAMLAHLKGVVGVDPGRHSPDEPLSEWKIEGVQSLLEGIRASIGKPAPTIRDLILRTSRSSRVAGTPEQIADELERSRAAEIDGGSVSRGRSPPSCS